MSISYLSLLAAVFFSGSGVFAEEAKEATTTTVVSEQTQWNTDSFVDGDRSRVAEFVDRLLTDATVTKIKPSVSNTDKAHR